MKMMSHFKETTSVAEGSPIHDNENIHPGQNGRVEVSKTKN
jgi:hypothetical protein